MSWNWRALYQTIKNWVMVDSVYRSRIPDKFYRKPLPPDQAKYSFPQKFPTKTEAMSGASTGGFHYWDREYREPQPPVRLEVSHADLGKQALEPLSPQAEPGKQGELKVVVKELDLSAYNWESFGAEPPVPPSRNPKHDTSTNSYVYVA